MEEKESETCVTIRRLRGNTEMKLLFGTGNQAQLSVMKSRLEKIGIELIGLNDLAIDELEQFAVEDGVLLFFKKALNLNG